MRWARVGARVEGRRLRGTGRSSHMLGLVGERMMMVVVMRRGRARQLLPGERRLRLTGHLLLLLAVHHLVVIIVLVPQLVQLLLKRGNIVDRLFQNHCFRVLGALAKGDRILQQLETAINIFSSTLLGQNVGVPSRRAAGR